MYLKCYSTKILELFSIGCENTAREREREIEMKRGMKWNEERKRLPNSVAQYFVYTVTDCFDKSDN